MRKLFLQKVTIKFACEKTNAIILRACIYISKQDANKALFGQLERDFEDPRGYRSPEGGRYST